MPDVSETVSLLLTLFAGMGLAAASGLRASVPLLILGFAARWERVAVVDSFAWLAATPVLSLLAGVVLVEMALRHRAPQRLGGGLGRRVASVGAAVTGGLACAALLVDLQGPLGLALGLFVGASVALAVERPLSGLRERMSTSGAGESSSGLGSPGGETASSVLISALSLYAPIAAPMLVMAVVAGSIHMRRQEDRRQAAA